jgi:hypothetical protein
LKSLPTQIRAQKAAVFREKPSFEKLAAKTRANFGFRFGFVPEFALGARVRKRDSGQVEGFSASR